MDFGSVARDVTSALNRWLALVSDYFSSLNQNEVYGWLLEALGFLLLVAGIILL